MTSTTTTTDETDDDLTRTPSSDDGATGDSAAVWRSEGWRYVELLAVAGLAIAQPLLSLYGNNAEEFVTSNSSPLDIALFGLAIVLIPPAVLLAVTAPLRLVSPRVELIVHRVVLAGLIGLTVVQLARDLPPAGRWVLGIAAFAGMAALLFRFDATRTWLRYVAALPVLSLVMFLFASNVTPVMFQSGPEPTSGAAVDVGNPIPVVFLLLDELPTASLMDGTGQIDAALYPNFARLAAGSTWYPDTTAIAPNTPWSVPAILTGRYTDEATAIAQNYPDNLFTMLGDSYDMHVQETVTDICPSDLCTRFSAGAAFSVTGLLSGAVRAWFDRFGSEAPTEETRIQLSEFIDTADGVHFHDPVRLTNWMDGLSDDGTPRVNLIHSVLPHYPWHLSPNGYEYDSEVFTKYEGLAFNWSSERGAETARRRHLLQLQYLDGWLGAIIDRLEETGLWDDALIVVTADHGVSFQPAQPIRGTSQENAWEIMWVPFFLRAPGLPEGAVDQRGVTTVDIVPTIADVLDVTMPYEPDGVSALLPDPPDQPTRFMHDNPMNTLSADEYGYATVPAAPNLIKVLQAPRRGQGDDDLRLWRIDEWGALIGTAPDAHSVTEAWAGGTVEVEGAGTTRTFDPGSDEAPLDVVAHIPGKFPGERVAIALNGTIIDVAPYSAVNAVAWTVLPDTRFVRGTNELTFYAVQGTPAEPILVPVPAT